MSYLLYTNVCIRLLEDVANSVRSKYDETHLEGETIYISSVVLFELRYGAVRSTYPFANMQRLERFLHQDLTYWPSPAPMQ